MNGVSTEVQLNTMLENGQSTPKCLIAQSAIQPFIL